MDNMCIWLEKVLDWVDRCGPPAIPFIGTAAEGYRNPPAPHLELAYLLDNRISDLAIGDRVVSIPPYHVTLFNVHQGAFTPTMQPFNSWCLFLDVGQEDAFTELYQSPLFCSAPLPRNEEVNAAFERLGRLCVRYQTHSRCYPLPASLDVSMYGRTASPAGAIRIKAALLELLALLLDLLAPDDDHPVHPPAIQRAIEFMSLHYSDPGMRLPDVVKAAGLSIHHFGRLFRQHMDETPMHYLQTLRVHHARYLLANTDLRIDEIAADVGIPDPLHFSRIFRTQTGLSPRTWRNQNGGAGQ